MIPGRGLGAELRRFSRWSSTDEVQAFRPSGSTSAERLSHCFFWVFAAFHFYNKTQMSRASFLKEAAVSCPDVSRC